MDWFRSYLKDRTQRGQLSAPLSIPYGVPQGSAYGVPQGSVLGTLLFLLYINDSPQASSVLGFHLFADDTSLFFSHPNLNVTEDTVNEELGQVSDWLIANIALEYTHRYDYLMQAGSMINITIFFSFQTHHMNSTRRLTK